jgi:outer membrane receptor protein involved in Fe transport
VREASRAVTYDYANYSAHQFLADSYDALRDPQQINLRYETPWFDELMMSDLLSPASAGNLSEFSSQRQYARLFEQNHFGASSDTEYLSNGSWLQKSSLFGNYNDYAYAVDDEYRSQNGWRSNNDLEDNTASVKAKIQLTPQDILFLEGIYYYSTFGDVGQYYNQYGTVPGVQPVPSTTFSGKEWQQPNIFLGYNHEWAPGVHTLVLGGYLNDTLNYTDPQANIPVAGSIFGQPPSVTSAVFPVTYSRRFDAYSIEVQQLFQTVRQTLVVGARVQEGWNNTYASEINLLQNPNPTLIQPNLETTVKRYTGYGYETIRLFDQLQVIGGLTYDYLDYPVNIETAPITSQETSIDQWSPKAGFIWNITPETALRFAYTRSLGGLSFDNSVRLEPTQVGGFNQAFRSIIPESVVGVVPGSRFTQYAVGVDRSFKSNTYITIQGQILDSDGSRGVGAFSQNFLPIPQNPITINETLDYTEQTLAASVNQLVGDHWSGGGRYQLSHAELNSQFSGYTGSQNQTAQFQQLTMYLNYYHQCGFFSQFQSIWTHQTDFGYSPSLASSDFWQFNVYAGYRFLHRAAEIKVGVLNLTDQNYLLNPLNLYYDMPRGRTLAVSLKFYF